jgi:hypothetical protein
MILITITGILTMIMVRTLRKDIAKYNREDDLVSVLYSMVDREGSHSYLVNSCIHFTLLPCECIALYSLNQMT